MKKILLAVLRREDGRYLLVRSPKQVGPHSGKWYPAGGTYTDDMDLNNFLKAKIFREVGLDIKPISLMKVTPADLEDIEIEWWGCELVSGEVKIGESIHGVAWYSLEEMEQIELWPATKKFFFES